MRWLVLVPMAACGIVSPCSVDESASELAGTGAIDCGTNDADGWSCAADALAAGSPFWLDWSETGTDSVANRAVASDGTVAYSLFQDEYGHPHGGGEVAANVCEGPSIEEGTLDCTAFEPEGNHYRVCGHDAGQRPPPLELPK